MDAFFNAIGKILAWDGTQDLKLDGNIISDKDYRTILAALDAIDGLDLVGDEQSSPSTDLYYYIHKKLIVLNRYAQPNRNHVHAKFANEMLKLCLSF